MESNTIEGNWKQLKGKLREKWGQFKSEDLDAFEGDVLKGKGEQLAGKIQEAYGTTKEEAQATIEKIKKTCNC